MSFTNFPHGITSMGHPVGPNIQALTGDSFFVTAPDSATNKFRTWAREHLPNDKLFTTIAAAEDACTAGRNDTVYVFPGTYTTSASLTWDKCNTHLVGLGGPLSRGGVGNGVFINTETAAVESVIDIQGDQCMMYNVHLRNAGADTGNLCALKVSSGENFYAEGCQFTGMAAATQIGAATGCSLWFYSSSNTAKPWGATFVNCRIGSASETVRTAGFVILFSGAIAYAPKYFKFEGCTIESYSETSTTPAVHIDEHAVGDRYAWWKDCLFYNFSPNRVTSMNEVFDNDDAGASFNHILQNCVSFGFTSWDTSGNNNTWCAYAADAGGYGILEQASTD
jgi:hypothetical protein